MDTGDILTRLLAHGVRQSQIAEVLQLSPDKISKAYAGARQIKAAEATKLLDWLAKLDRDEREPDLPDAPNERDYVAVKVLPSFAGMGGGGTGEGDREIAMLSRRLIEEELRGSPNDFELIDVRGESMTPDFLHGDSILVDKRDRDPRQPGPFALWDGDGYVVKLVERVPNKRGWYRIFSANGRYSEYEVEETETTIMGRPVWFARRL